MAVVYVRGQVLGQVVGPGKALAAHLAVIRSLAGVYAQVPGQVAFAAERAAAEQARERSFARMLAHVQLQVLLGPDAFAAERARERLGVPVVIVVNATAVVVVGSDRRDGSRRYRDGSSGRRGGPCCYRGDGSRPLSVRPEYVEQRRRRCRRSGRFTTVRSLSRPGRRRYRHRRRLRQLRGHHLVRAGYLAVGRRRLGCGWRGRHVPAVVTVRRRHRRRHISLQSFQRVVEPMLFERFEIPVRKTRSHKRFHAHNII